jgi:hypothetical protein
VAAQAAVQKASARARRAREFDGLVDDDYSTDQPPAELSMPSPMFRGDTDAGEDAARR